MRDVEKPHDCPECSESFRTDFGVNQHVARSHPDRNP